MLLIFTFITYTLQVILYVNDTYQYKLTDLFGYLENPTYHAVTSGFNIISQYYQYLDIKKHNQYADQIISVKAQYNQGYWTNHFLFLENNKGQYNLHYSENLQEENIATPQFNEHLFISKNDQCFDAEQYDQNNYIIDCIQIIDQQPLQNKLYVINKDSTIKIYNVSNPYNYQTIKKRKLNLLKLEQQIYLLQGTLQEIESIIQIYQINQNNITFIEQENEINSKILIILFQLQNTFKFYLIDYKLVYNQIFILDKTFIASLSFDNNGEWTNNLFIPINGNIIAFDYVYYIDENGQQNKILVILKDKTFDLYYNDQSIITYTLIKTISMNSQIKISHQYIIIEDENTIYQYTIKNKILLNQKTLSQVNFYLINPIYPDLISISYNLTRRYFISDGYIQINSQSILQPTYLYIQATSKNQTYNKEIYCQIIDYNDNNLYSNGKQQQIITDVLYKINQTQDIIQFMSGPNLEYVFLKQDQDLDLEFENIQLMNIKEFPQSQNIQFQDMLQFNDTLIYHIFQLKDKSIEFYSCSQNTFSLIEQCQLNFKTNNFPINLNSLHFQWWIDQEQAYMIFCSSEYTADLWKLNTQELLKIKAITYLQPITQVLELKGTIYILVESQKKIGVYNSLDGQFLDTIDEKLIKSLGLLKSWTPKRIYGNQKYQSHLLFIKNNDNILITIYNKQINLVECILINEDIQITVAQKSFFVIKVNTTTSLLQEYSIIDLNNIYLIRNLQLYDHQFYNPLQITQSEDNGFLFILTKQKQILLYQPQSENSNDQLFRIFDVNYTDTIMMSASGYKKTHFYFNNGEQYYYYAFLMQTKVYLQSININSLDYYVNTQKTLTVQNNDHSKLYLETLNILNTNYPLYLNFQNITLNASKEQILYIFDNQFHGSIESYQYNINQNTTIEFIQPLNKINRNIIENIIDIEYYNDNYNIAINKDQLFLINNKNNAQSIIDFHQPNSCEFLIVQQNQEYILTLCNYNNKYHIYLINCDQNMKCQIIDTPKDLLDLQGISKIQLISENLLLIQDFGKIYIYYIKRETETWSIVLTQIIDNQRGMTDFIIQSYIEKNYYILSFIDQADYLNIYYTQFQQSKLNIISQDSILIYDVIIKNNQYAFKTTDYIQLFSLQEVISNPELNYLIIANDVASITLNVQLDSDKKIKETKISAVFNPYQDWKAINKAYITYNHIFIPYTNKERIILSYYYLNNTNISQNMIQGLNDKAFTVTDGIFTVFSYTNKQNTSKLFCNINKTLDVYEINQYPMLKITNSDQFPINFSQIITISISNPNKQDQMSFILNFIPIPIPPDPNDTHKSYWWLITIIIIGSLGIIGGLGYYLWKRKQQKMVRDHYVLN